MSHTRVKAQYEVEGSYGSTETYTLYCHHNHSADFTIFYDEDGDIELMQFQSWSIEGKNKLDAMQKLLSPYKDQWGGELKDGVEYYSSKEINRT